MGRGRKLYWTKEKCQIEALKYHNKSDFSFNSSNAYTSARLHNWLDEICIHMSKPTNKKPRLIYAYEFSNNHVYIGLTQNIEKRQSHRNIYKFDTVTKYIEETGIIPERKILTELLDVNIAAKMEGEILEKYKSNGWIILNKSKTGALGGNTIKWTKEACLESAKKYITKTFWRKNEGGAHDAAKTYGNKFFEECCSHMINGNKNRNLVDKNYLIHDIEFYLT